jgi:hypothetical protein
MAANLRRFSLRDLAEMEADLTEDVPHYLLPLLRQCQDQLRELERLRVALVKARAAVMHLGQQQSIPDDDSWSMDLIDIDAALAAQEA